MNANDVAVVQKRFESPDEVRTFEKGKLEVVRIGALTIGRASYEPGWQWSKHVGPQVGAARCHVEHVGMVLSGVATVAFDDGTVSSSAGRALLGRRRHRTTAGWSSDWPYVSLHFMGAEKYAK